MSVSALLCPAEILRTLEGRFARSNASFSVCGVVSESMYLSYESNRAFVTKSIKAEEFGIFLVLRYAEGLD